MLLRLHPPHFFALAVTSFLPSPSPDGVFPHGLRLNQITRTNLQLIHCGFCLGIFRALSLCSHVLGALVVAHLQGRPLPELFSSAPPASLTSSNMSRNRHRCAGHTAKFQSLFLAPTFYPALKKYGWPNQYYSDLLCPSLWRDILSCKQPRTLNVNPCLQSSRRTWPVGREVSSVRNRQTVSRASLILGVGSRHDVFLSCGGFVMS